jgi:hypothetical protein
MFNLDVPPSCWYEELLQQTQKGPQVPPAPRFGKVEQVLEGYSRRHGL